MPRKNKGIDLIKIHKYLLAGLVIAVLQLSTQVTAMDQPAAAARSVGREEILARYKSLDQIKPVSSKPITRVPHYVFENCNQATRHSWTAGYLAKLRAGTGKLTVASTKEMFTKDGKLDVQKFTTTAEGYDWVHALNLIETEYLAKNYTSWAIADIKNINKAAARLLDPSPGEFRNDNIRWNMHDFSVEEFLFCEFMIQELYNDAHKLKYNPQTDIVDPSSIKAFLNSWKNNKAALLRLAENHADGNRIRNASINPDIVDAWLAEQSSTEERGLRYQAWLQPRIHVFPSPETIALRIERTLNDIKVSMAAYSPIGKAAYLWYEIVRIHPWHEANKRTGKLLASAILLQHGYLPPIITEKDAQKYVDLLKYGFKKSTGAIEFVEFIAHLIEKTQSDPEILKQVAVATP